jgi:hypothetical protein
LLLLRYFSFEAFMNSLQGFFEEDGDHSHDLDHGEISSSDDSDLEMGSAKVAAPMEEDAAACNIPSENNTSEDQKLRKLSVHDKKIEEALEEEPEDFNACDLDLECVWHPSRFVFLGILLVILIILCVNEENKSSRYSFLAFGGAACIVAVLLSWNYWTQLRLARSARDIWLITKRYNTTIKNQKRVRDNLKDQQKIGENNLKKLTANVKRTQNLVENNKERVKGLAACMEKLEKNVRESSKISRQSKKLLQESQNAVQRAIEDNAEDTKNDINNMLTVLYKHHLPGRDREITEETYEALKKDTLKWIGNICNQLKEQKLTAAQINKFPTFQEIVAAQQKEDDLWRHAFVLPVQMWMSGLVKNSDSHQVNKFVRMNRRFAKKYNKLKKQITAFIKRRQETAEEKKSQ